MATLEELRNERLRKLSLLQEKGINPFPSSTARTESNQSFLEHFEKREGGKTEVTLAGRVKALRGQGGIIFADIDDGTGKVQALIRKEDVSDEVFSLFKDTIDIGDFVEVTGTALTTAKGEKSIQANGWGILAKSLLPLPDKWSGLQDVDERYRKRYLDIISDPELKNLFIKKSKFWNTIRTFLIGEGFIEVETPVLENTTGGADARPFKTHHNALDMDVYLRISCGELWQKRLIVAGFPKVFEIGRIFRNEGISAEHAQDYTQMEFYWSYANAKDGMALVEKMYKLIAQEVFGTLEFTIGEYKVDLGKKWEHYDYKETIKKITSVDIDTASLEDIEHALTKHEVVFDKKNWNKVRAIDTLWKYCRKQLSGPGFLVNVPVALSPLAKLAPNKQVVEQFQPIIAGSEVGKGYSELNDPIDQALRFEEQQRMRDAGDDEAQMFDRDFVEALEHGMPPTCGFGVSERLFAFLANKPIRETQIFPLMRPK